MATQQQAQAALNEARTGTADIAAKIAKAGLSVRDNVMSSALAQQQMLQGVPESVSFSQDGGLVTSVLPPIQRIPGLRGSKHLFRSDPGHRNVGLRIPGVPSLGGEPEVAEKREAYFRRQFESAHPDKRKQERLRKIAKENGSLTIQFTPIARRQECYLETDSDLIAGYLDEKIADGTLPQVYRDAPVLIAEEMADQAPHRAQAAMRLKLAKGLPAEEAFAPISPDPLAPANDEAFAPKE